MSDKTAGMLFDSELRPIGFVAEPVRLEADNEYITPDMRGTLTQETAGTLSFKLEEFADAIVRLGFTSTSAANAMLMFERDKCLYRHRFIWQYKRERKGQRKYSRTRFVKIKTVFPNARIVVGNSAGQ